MLRLKVKSNDLVFWAGRPHSMNSHESEVGSGRKQVFFLHVPIIYIIL